MRHTQRFKRPQWKMPHTYVLLTYLLLLAAALTYCIPGGEYQRILDPSTGSMVILPESFHPAQGKRPGLFDLFLNLQRGYVSAADILFLILFAYAYVSILVKNGTLYGIIQGLIQKLGGKTQLLIPIAMICFGLLGACLGIFEEVYGLIPVFMGITTALGYDRLVGGAIVYVGVATGFSAALTNPFSIGIAQSIAQIPINSGLLYRVVIFLAFQSISILYVMHYARQVKANPKASLVYGEPFDIPLPQGEGYQPLTRGQQISLILFLLTIFLLIYGTLQLQWYIREIGAMFLMMMVLSALVSGYSPSQTAQELIESTRNIVPSILMIGFTRGILITMQDAKISDTIVHNLSQLLQGSNPILSALGMLLLQNTINFFISGSSSQAAITMPIMAPVADLVGLHRQTAVLCYSFGDGFSDLFWPTGCSLGCGLMGISLPKWYQFIAPLFFWMVLLQIFFVSLSVFLYSPTSIPL